MKPTDMNIEFVFCDYTNSAHRNDLASLINQYMTDPMGGVVPLDKTRAEELVNGLAAHSSGFVIFAQLEGKNIGLATCFINFSTFKAKPYLNIHDVIVEKKYRGNHIGRKLLEKCISIAREKNYCKVTLEVREDNVVAKKLYKSLDFKDCKPIMHFWTKTLL
jgi:ribosomal protein S18 acetylase RimI-like enzyme